MSKSTHKTRVTIADLSEQVQAMDRRLSEVLSPEGNGDGFHPHVNSILRPVSELRFGRRDGRRRLVNVIQVDDLTRGMLLCRAQTEAAINEAITRYLEAKHALRRIRTLRIEPAKTAQVVIAYLSHWLGNGERDLGTLGVTITLIEPGVPFNCKVHEIFRRQPAETKEQVDTVATARSPLFSWKDAQGKSQICPAKVVVYSEPLGSM